MTTRKEDSIFRGKGKNTILFSLLLAGGIFYAVQAEEEISSLNEEIRYAEEVGKTRLEEIEFLEESLELQEEKSEAVVKEKALIQSEKEVLQVENDSLQKVVEEKDGSIASLKKEVDKLKQEVAVSSSKKNNQPESPKPSVQGQEAKEPVVSEQAGKERQSDSSGWKTMSVNASAYTLVENGDKMGGTGLTSTGTVPTSNRTIAVDPSVIPYGSHIKYNGVTYIAEDTGGIINGNKVDIYVDTLDAALNFGRKDIEIQVKFP